MGRLLGLFGGNSATDREWDELFEGAPKTALNMATREQARRGLTKVGMQCSPTYGKALRPLLPSEEWDNESGAPVGFTYGDTEQLRVELDRSGLVAVRVPAVVADGTRESAPYRSLLAGLDKTPTLLSADRNVATLLFKRPAGESYVKRALVLDEVLGAFVPCPAQENVVAIPHEGCLERWEHLGTVQPLPSELHGLLTASASVADGDVAEWIAAHYRKSKRNDRGMKRDEVYRQLLAANDWTPRDYPIEALSRAVQAVSFFDSQRRNDGIYWRLERNDKPLASLSGVPVESIDQSELAAFRAWRASYEMSPKRRKERAEAKAMLAQKAAEEADLRRKFGTRETLEMLQTPIGGEHYFPYHHGAETKRRQACDAMALEFVPLPLDQAKPEWWALSPAGTPHDVRYRKLVATFARPATGEAAQ